jgi:hypothetical protein
MPTKSARAVPRKLSKTNSAKIPLAGAVEQNDDLIRDALAGIRSTRGTVKLGSSKALRLLSQRVPELLYPHFEFFTALLDEENLILKWNAILTLANLARVDDDSRIERILDRYLEPVRGPNLITAANTIRGAAMIGAAIPALIPRIIPVVMAAENAAYATPECRNVAIGHALKALAVLAPQVADTSAIRRFAARQLGNPRPATSAKALRLQKCGAAVA